MKRAWLWLIQRTLNKATLRSARGGRGPFAIVRHVGRKTGIVRETPIIVAPVKGGLMVELTYGAEVQWYQNVIAAGGCTIVLHGVEHRIVGFEPMPAAIGRRAYPKPARLVLKLLGREHFVLFKEDEAGRLP